MSYTSGVLKTQIVDTNQYDPDRYAVSMRKRPVNIGTPYYLPMSIALTGVANENVTGKTNTNFNDNLLILGGESDLETSQVLFSLPGSLPEIWSQSVVPVKTLFGTPDSARPVLWWPYPTPLKVGRFVAASVLNGKGEGAGTFVFHCAQPTDGPTTLEAARLGPTQIISIDSQFTGTASEQTSTVADPLDYDFLLLGFFSDLALAQIQIIDVQRRFWMSDPCPIWSVAGRQSSELAVQYLRVPYFIPAQQMIKVLFYNNAANPEASGQLHMVGQRLLDI
jgi:hypothetical protein